jgi:RNA polymerase sigma factor FliA
VLDPGNNDAAQKESEKLWRRFATGSEAEIREQLIEHYTGFARMLAAKSYARRQIAELEFADFLQLALVGLVEAIDRFEPGRDIRFESYASARITGAILNGVAKSTDRQEQINLRTRLRRQRSDSLYESDTQEGTSSPLFEKLADFAVGMAVGYMLEDSGMFQQAEQASAPSAYERTEFKQLCEIVRRLVELLPEQQRRIVKYHYFHGHTFERIAELVRLTVGRISQLHKKSVQGLRKLFRQYGALNDRL